MNKLRYHVTDTSYDTTQRYSINFIGTLTLGEAIDEIISDAEADHDKGTIKIDGFIYGLDNQNDWEQAPKYDDISIASKRHNLNATVKAIGACGSWGQMDYWIITNS